MPGKHTLLEQAAGQGDQPRPREETCASAVDVLVKWGLTDEETERFMIIPNRNSRDLKPGLQSMEFIVYTLSITPVI